MKQKNCYNFIKGMLAGILCVLCFISITKYFGIHLFSSSSLADDIRTRAKVVESYIDRYYWKEDISDQKISEYAAKGMVAALGDRYSEYYTSQELKDHLEQIEGDYAGIGATMTVEPETGAKKISKLEKGMPAERAGLQVGDELLTVNGKDVAKLSLDEAVALIKGEEGKKSVLTVKRTEKKECVIKKITVVTEKIVTQSVQSKMLEDKIGYIAVSNFTKETVNQFEKSIEQLDKKNQRGLVIDLRNNGGGSLTACVAMLDRMLPKGDLIIEKNRATGDRQYNSTDKQHFDKPVLILINGGSASASEVFAGCMQDRKAATLLGTKSYGKGIVQTVFSLEKSCGGGIKLTTGEYVLPGKRCIQGKGLTPDVEEPYTGKSQILGAKDDNQLLKAMQVMKTILS